SVMIAGRDEQVTEGTTLAGAASAFDLRPKPGNLLDVQGAVLRAGAFPGSLLLNGRSAPRSTKLHQGDRITLTDGRDHTEPLRRRIVSVPKGVPSNPQFFLSRTPGVQVVARGALSHELVSGEFRPKRARAKVERAVALTFDDGPSPTDTPRVL